MGNAALIPDRRRNHFPLNGGPRLTDRERRRGHQGIEAAREVLEATTPEDPPAEPQVQKALSPAQIRRARNGLAAARAALRDEAA